VCACVYVCVCVDLFVCITAILGKVATGGGGRVDEDSVG